MRCGSHNAAARNASAGSSAASLRHGRSRGSANVDARSTSGDSAHAGSLRLEQRQQQSLASAQPVSQRDDFGGPVRAHDSRRRGPEAP